MRRRTIDRLGMKRHLVILLLFTLCSVWASAQLHPYITPSYFESFKTRFERATKDLLIDSMLVLEREIETAFRDIEEDLKTMDVSISKQYYNMKYAELELYIGAYYLYKQKQYDTSIRYLLVALNNPYGSDAVKKRANLILGRNYQYKAMEKRLANRFKDALGYSDIALKYLADAADTIRLIEEHVMMAENYVELLDYSHTEEQLNIADTLLTTTKQTITRPFGAEMLVIKAREAELKGEVPLAIPLLEQAYETFNNFSFPMKNERMQSCAMKLARLYRHHLHNETKAAQWDRKLSQLADAQDSDKSEDRRLSYLNRLLVAMRIASKGQYETAIDSLDVLIPDAQRGGMASAFIGDCYKEKAYYLTRLRKNDEAITYYQKALESYDDLFENYKSISVCHYRISLIYYAADSLSRSVESAQEALRYGKRAYGKHSEDLKSLYTLLANVHAFNGDTLEAKHNYAEAFDIVSSGISSSFAYLTAKDRETYWSKLQKDVFNMQPFMLKLRDNDSEFTDLLYDAALLSKGLLLQSSSELQRLASRPDMRPLLDSIADLHQRATNKKLTPEQVEEIEAEAEKREQELMRRARGAADFLSFLKIRHDDVKRRLSPRTIAVEFAQFAVGKDSLLTVAYLMHPQREHVRMIPLFEQRELDALNDSLIYSTPAFYDKLWQPILEQAGEVDTIFFSPAGSLYSIAIEYMPDHTLTSLSDRLAVVRLSSTRQLLLGRKGDIRGDDAVLYGGLRYLLSKKEQKQIAEKYRGADYPNNRLVADSLSASDDALRDFVEGLTFLPGSLREVKSIAPLFAHPTLKTGNEGVEESLKALSGQAPTILHVSTHGYALPVPDNEKNSLTAQLHYCGLAFSGAERALNNMLIDSIDDGLLTAYEAADLDLSGCRLAVLSACKTAAGTITSDGVAGLQRGFKQAGVETMIISLWNVSDKATEMLMTEFYKLWRKDRQPMRTAFVKAQQRVRKVYPAPHYWAGFIMLD